MEKEPTLEEYGLNAFSYENFKKQKKDLEKEIEKIREYKNENEKSLRDLESKSETNLLWVSYLLGFLTILFSSKEITFSNIVLGIFGGIFLGYIIAIFFEIIADIFHINLYSERKKELKANFPKYDIDTTIVKEKIKLLENKFENFEKASVEYYQNYLKQFFENYLYKKRSGNELFEKSLSEFSSMIDEVKEINKKLILRHVYPLYETYLIDRQINHNYQKNKKFSSFDDIKIKSEYIDNTKEITQTQPIDLVEKKANDILNEKQAPIISTIINSNVETPIIIKDNTNSKEVNLESNPEDKNKGFWANLMDDVKAEIDEANDKNSTKDIINTIDTVSPDKKYSAPRKIDWENINKNKAITGLKGEEIVVEIEKNYLKSINREDLAEKVKHTSTEGDGSGYDILSYFPDGQEKYIEVKSSRNSNSNSFNISSNELDFMKRNQYNYQIYRMFNINENDETPTLRVHTANDILSFKKITPVQYVVKME